MTSVVLKVEIPNVAAKPSRQWASHKKFVARKTSGGRQGEAVMKVGALADEKRAYYRELLEMRRTEHQQKLEVLELKHSYYTAKLQKLKEE